MKRWCQDFCGRVCGAVGCEGDCQGPGGKKLTLTKPSDQSLKQAILIHPR